MKRRREAGAEKQAHDHDDAAALDAANPSPAPTKRRRVRAARPVSIKRAQTACKNADAVASAAPPHAPTHTPLQARVVAAAQAVLDALGCGFSESVYRDALAVELQQQHGVQCFTDREVVLPVHYRQRYVGYCRSDLVLLCADEQHDATCATSPLPPFVIECKATNKALAAAHAQQLLAYMRLLRARHGVRTTPRTCALALTKKTTLRADVA